MNGAAPRINRRRQWLVNKPFQFRFVRILLVFYGLLTVLTLASVYLALWVTLYSFELLHDPVTVSLFATVGWTVALELLLVAPLVLWAGVLLSHRVAGPLVRILATIRQMTEGRLDTPIVLRKHDELQELAAALNDLADSLRSRQR